MRNILDKLSGYLFTLLLLSLAFYTGFNYGKDSIPPQAQIFNLCNLELGKPQTVDFTPFWEAWKIVDEKFVSVSTTTDTSDVLSNIQKRVWGAISGMVDALGDPHTVFMPPDESKNFETEISGSFEGVGMEIAVKDDILTVVAPLKNSPAERAGILPGDIILKIDDTPTTKMKAEQAVKFIRGKKGTEVRLLIERPNKGSKPFEVKIVRDTIQIPTIDTELKVKLQASDLVGNDGQITPSMLKDSTFIIRFYSFTSQSPAIFRQALREFVESGARKLVIDLRGNPGGFLDAAIDITSWFIEPGKVIVRESFGQSKSERIYRSRGYGAGLFKDVKIAILVDAGSASASEIMAGAMREHGKAVLVGTTTFGKGSVQELVKITPETSLKITVARWLTPNGHSISENGLKPDYEVKYTEEDRNKKKDPQLKKALEVLDNLSKSDH
jgi:carboxyl-terminal processing protease